jgi:protoporphyrinogen oxidase
LTQNNSVKTVDVVCIGAGPAGLTAGYLLGKANRSCCILEKDPRYVGGISRTVEYNGFRFDIGGHRFFSKSSEIEALWDEILGADFIERPRKSRIFYRGKFFSYPLKPFDALWKLGFYQSALAVCSYFKSCLFPIKPIKSFQDWVSNQFGTHLFQIFFKTYTEKVWGVACTDISPDWASQRIKGLSLMSAVVNAFKPQGGDAQIKTLITHFRYPRLGPGMMWEAAADKIRAQNNHIELDADVSALHYLEDEQVWDISYRVGHQIKHVKVKHVLSSMPIRALIPAIKNIIPEDVLRAAAALKYRDFLTVALMINNQGSFDDNWIYIHEPNVKVGRIQNFRSWSPELIPDDNKNCYGLEYFCFEGDGLWTSKDSDLIELAKKEMCQIGLVKADEIIDGCVVRQPKAYPVYDEGYKQNVAIIRDYLKQQYPSLHLVGRNGMHKYNNQDHAMMTAKLTVENIIRGTDEYDVWHVNEDAEYHEGITERLVPQKIQ